MATQPSPEERLLKVIKEGASATQPSPEEQLLKVVKEGSQTANVATSTISAPASSAVKLKLKQPQSPPSVPPAQTDAKPALSGSGEAAAAVPIVAPKSESAEQPVSSSPSSLRGYFKGAAQSLAARYASGAQRLAIFRRIEVINRSLALVLVLLLGGFVYFVVLGRPDIEKTVSHFPPPAVRSLKPGNHEAFMTSGEYVKMSKKRDIFNSEQLAAVKGSTNTWKPDVPQNKTDLRLVGIYFNETAPEVIIEDQAEKKTYFLKEGDNIKGIKVKSIRRDSVILESNGSDWELHSD